MTTKAAKHTPGPWTFTHDQHIETISIECGYDDECQIAEINVENLDDRAFQAIADARLISASPDLLAALQRALDAGIGGDGNRPSPAEMARAAIAKALGS